MSVAYADDTFRLLTGDVRSVLADLEDESVRCVVTSPPYWGLRDYGTGTWEGGSPDCDHSRLAGGVGKGTIQGTQQADGRGAVAYRETCAKCGARRVDRQIGLEPTPDDYVASMVDVFREVRRVLRDDGTLWLNIGDSYNANGRDGHGTRVGPKQQTNQASANGADLNRPTAPGLKQKDLVGIPWLLAFALRADGWYLRSEIIWHKPNPMPESVRDRPTKSHEQVFLLTKSSRYFYDADGIREPHAPDGRRVTAVVGREGSIQHRNGERWPGKGRNARSVWTIVTQPYKEAHFATFPEALAEKCIRAGTAEGDVVLDPFVGSGTVAQVARSLGRRCVGVDLNPEYAELAVKRYASPTRAEKNAAKARR